MKQVVVFGSKAGEQVIGNMIEDNLPVEVIRVETEKDQPYVRRTESEIREWAEEELLPFIGHADVIVFCEPEITLSAGRFLRTKYPDQPFIGYGQHLARLLRRGQDTRVLLSNITKRMTRYQEIKSENFGVRITECEYDPYEDHEQVASEENIERILDGFQNGTIIIYTPSLIPAKSQIEERVKWRGEVLDMRQSLFRETCAALKFRGLDGRLTRDLKG